MVANYGYNGNGKLVKTVEGMNAGRVVLYLW